MKNADFLTPKEALAFMEENYDISVSTQSLRDWSKSYKGLSKKIVGRWYINKRRLTLLMEGKTWRKAKEEDESQ